MTTAARLAEGFASGALVHPTAGPSAVDLATALASWAGVPGLERRRESIDLDREIGDPRHLVFVLADGLGTPFLGHAPFLAAHLRRRLSATFPSSTAVALATLATAAPPARHAVLGWWTHHPGLGEAVTVLPFERRRDRKPLTQLGVSRESVLPLDGVFAGARCAAASFIPQAHLSSIFSQWALRGTQRIGYRKLSEAVDGIACRVEAAAQPTYTYLYWPDIDGMAHHHGTCAGDVTRKVRELDAEMERLSRSLPCDVRVVLSADHGHLDFPPGGPRCIRPGDSLAACLRHPPSGDGRAMFFHVRPDAHGEFVARFAELAEDRFALLAAVEAEAGSLLGENPVSGACRERLGDYVSISLGPDLLLYMEGPEAPSVLRNLRSTHGGLTREEMEVPLVVFAGRASDW